MTAASTPRPSGLRAGLRRLSVFLLVYGAIGVIVAVIGLGALWWALGRIDRVTAEADTSIGQLAASVDRASDALADAGQTAQSFSVTVQGSADAVDQAARTVGNVQPRLEALETQFRSISILGNRPLASAADVVGGIADDIEGLDARLAGIAVSLRENSTSLVQNALSLTALSQSLGALADRLQSGVIQTSIDDLRSVQVIVVLVLVAWTLVPAIGALGLGWWLRRELGPA